MVDPRVEKLADLIVNYSIEAKPGQKVLVHGHVQAQSLLLEIAKEDSAKWSPSVYAAYSGRARLQLPQVCQR